METKTILHNALATLMLCLLGQFVNAQSLTPRAQPDVAYSCSCHMTNYGCFGSQMYCIMYCSHYCHHMFFGDGETATNTTLLSTPTLLSFLNEKEENVSIRLYDVNGNLVKTVADKVASPGVNRVTWNPSDLQAGVYMLRFQTATNTETQTIFVSE